MKGSFQGLEPFYQFLFLVFLALGGVIIFELIGGVIASMVFPYSFKDLFGAGAQELMASDIELFKFRQGFSTIGTFMVPGLFAAYLLSEEPSEFIGLNAYPGKDRRSRWVITFLLILFAFSSGSISDALYRLSSSFTWPDYLSSFREFVEGSEMVVLDQMEAILQMDSPADFIEVFFILAILPAVGEETLFRGVMQPILQRATKNVHLGIWLTAFLFGLLHLQITGFLSIFVLGATLGYLRYWSGSLWVPIVMHLINNGSIVTAVYFFNYSYADVNDLSGGWQPLSSMILIVLFFLIGFGLFNLFKESRKGENKKSR